MELHYFLTTNGSQGHYSYLEQELAGYRDVIRLSGYPRTIAGQLVKECYAIAKQNRLDMHLVHNCLDNSCEGILFPGLKTALVNLPLNEKRLDLESLFYHDDILLCEEHTEKAFHFFKEAKKIHDEWEKIYIAATDYRALNTFTENTITKFLAGKKSGQKGSLCDRFFGSATINGAQDFITELTAETKRYFIKGRPGTGKSTFLKKFAQSACDCGYHVERYHCSFDPNSLDMVVVRGLSLCLFDSTAPHEYFPSQKSDEILDFYAVAVRPDTDRAFKSELDDIAARYKKTMGNATKELIAANSALLLAEDRCLKQIDASRLMDVRKMIIKRIFP